MNLKLLEGKSLTISGIDFENIKVRQEKDLLGKQIYYVNDTMVSKMDLVLAIGKLESSEKKNTSFLSKLGVFFLKRTVSNDYVTHSDRGVFFARKYGIRTYGYDKCGVFAVIQFGNTSFEFEFCWKHKDQYESGVFPDPYVKYTKVV